MILVTDLKTLESGSWPSEFEEELKRIISKLILSGAVKHFVQRLGNVP